MAIFHPYDKISRVFIIITFDSAWEQNIFFQFPTTAINFLNFQNSLMLAKASYNYLPLQYSKNYLTFFTSCCCFRFDEAFGSFLNLSQNLDQLLLVYLQAVFSKPVKTQQGLAILSK